MVTFFIWFAYDFMLKVNWERNHLEMVEKPSGGF